MNTESRDPPAAEDEDAAHFGFARFGNRIPGATAANWMNRPGVSVKSGKSSRLSRVVYISDSEVRVWGVRYPGFESQGAVALGRAFINDLLHRVPTERWMAFDQNSNAGFSSADLWLNTPGGAMVAYTTSKSGLVRARPLLLDDILGRLRNAAGGQRVNANEARKLTRPWLGLVADNAAGRLDAKGVADLRKQRFKISAGDDIKKLRAAESLYLRHLDAVSPDQIVRHVELFWETSHA